ncbi:helix-turn-helix domain-containing protein [Aquimarina rhabdastrellae]
MGGYKRIQQIIEHYNLNKSSLSRELGYSQNSTIGRIINEKREPSRKTLEKILKRFPDLNYDWLVMGKGTMFKDKKCNLNEKITLFNAGGVEASADEIAAYITQNIDNLKENKFIQLLFKSEGQAIAIDILTNKNKL